MSAIQQLFSSYGSGIPPAPPVTNVVLSCGLFNLFNNAGYPAGNLVSAGTADVGATLVAPYPVDWAYLIANSDPPPYLLLTLEDQNAQSNNLIAAGAARPTVQVTTSCLVTGGSQPGTYTYRTLFNGLAYYVLTGHSTGAGDDTVPYALYSDLATWTINNSSGMIFYQSAGNATAFPWQDTWTGITVAAATNGQGQIQTDGVATCMQSAFHLLDGVTTGATFYWYGSITNLAATGVVFETDPNGLTTAGGVSFRSVAGVATASVYSGAALNTKTISVVDTNPHLWEIYIDTTAVAANQIILKKDGSTTGSSSPISTDLASMALSSGTLSYGARNNGASNFLATTSSVGLFAFNVAQSGSAQTSWTNYLTWLGSLYVSPS